MDVDISKTSCGLSQPWSGCWIDDVVVCGLIANPKDYSVFWKIVKMDDEPSSEQGQFVSKRAFVD